MHTLPTNEVGEVLWTDLPVGDTHLMASGPGFRLRRLTVTVSDYKEQRVAALLEVAAIEDVPDLEVLPMPNPDTLDLAPLTYPKPVKRKWWRIFSRT
jgi:hypothetical protein